MATEVLMPRQGQSVESCLIVGWKKQQGDTVNVGDILCEVETDKATFEVEAPAAGVLLRTLYQADDEVPVLAPIAYIGEAGEAIEPEAAGDGETADSSRETTEEQAPTADKTSVDRTPERRLDPTSPERPIQEGGGATGESFISPRARRLAADKGLAWQRLSGTGPDGRIIERDVRTALAAGAPLTPTAAAAGAEAPPSEGSGIGGRVRAQDLAAESAPAAPGRSVSAAVGLPEFPGPVSETPVKGVRKVIAERMLASLQTTAQLTLNASADARALQTLRARLKASDKSLGLRAITINDLLHYAVARILPRFTYMNAHMSDNALKEFEHVHLGFAVDTSRGLMVPTIKFADALKLSTISEEAKRLAAVCQAGNAGPDDLAAGTFTVTNLGGLGVENFTPVLNPPQVAILGVSNIQLKPMQSGDEVAFVPSIGLSLTIDHRAVDGAPAARFLQALSAAIADIDLILAL